MLSPATPLRLLPLPPALTSCHDPLPPAPAGDGFKRNAYNKVAEALAAISFKVTVSGGAAGRRVSCAPPPLSTGRQGANRQPRGFNTSPLFPLLTSFLPFLLPLPHGQAAKDVKDIKGIGKSSLAKITEVGAAVCFTLFF